LFSELIASREWVHDRYEENSSQPSQHPTPNICTDLFFYQVIAKLLLLVAAKHLPKLKLQGASFE
jgi:hypothetical protein